MKKLTVNLMAVVLLITTGCKNEPAVEIPKLATAEVSEFTVNTAVAGGNVTDAGTPEYTERGICYGTTTKPVISGTKVVDEGTGIGSFEVELTDLTANTKYYVRAYVAGDYGVIYGNEIHFTTLEEPELSGECDILSFKDGEKEWFIDDDELIITAEYPQDTDLSNVVPTIEVSPGATVTPPSDEPQDFTDGNEVTYTVTAEDGVTEKVFTAKATIAPPTEE